MTLSLQTAQVLHASGVATIPCNADKTPRVPSWKPYMTALPTPTELERWFAKDSKIALIAGKVQCLDFDEKYSKGILARFCQRAEENGLDQLIGGLILQQTPSGGFHYVWQCAGSVVNNLKLAQKANLETLIETRGAGGYFLIAPSEGYKLIVGDWSSIPEITEDDRDALLTLARTFDERPPVEAHTPAANAPALGGEATPGDDFDFRADMPSLLKKHGWTPAGRDGKYWTRPGKTKGISASWDVVPGRFFVFSSSTQFEVNHVYRPWHVYTILECAGDYSKAASELRRQGFGGVAPAKPIQPLPRDWQPAIEASPEPLAMGVAPLGDAPTKETEEERIRRLLHARRFVATNRPEKMRVTFTLLDVPIATPGNLAAITAQAKVGKSALIQAFIAATMTESPDVDCLGVKGYNGDGRAVIYLDTEQSKDDFWWAVDRTGKRAAVPVTDLPPWLLSHYISDLNCEIQRKSLKLLMADATAKFGGIHSVFIDGVADMVLDVNDAEACNAYVAELFELASRFDCSIICVIHKNPGSDKTRGHLGSQLERKAETNLTLEKEDDSTLVFSMKQRRAPIYKADGARFAWSEEAGMHVTVTGSGKPKLSAALKEFELHAFAALSDGKALKFTDFSAALVKISGKSEATVNRQIANLRNSGLVNYAKSTGLYTSAQPSPF